MFLMSSRKETTMNEIINVIIDRVIYGTREEKVRLIKQFGGVLVVFVVCICCYYFGCWYYGYIVK